jgi:hypothetical protein
MSKLEQADAQEERRLPYVKPTLRFHGTFKDLTTAVNLGGNPDGGTPANVNRTAA